MNRNDPCWCGSGRKFKKCHGGVAVPGQSASAAADDSLSMVRRSEMARATAAKRLDMELNEALLKYAERRFGRAWLTNAVADFSFDELPDVVREEVELLGPWMLYHRPVSDIDPLPVAWHFRKTERTHREPAKDQLLEAQLSAMLGVWEVQSIERGVGSHVKDLLTGRERFVYDSASSQTLSPMVALLAFVVDVDGISFFGGIHLRPLPPMETSFVVQDTRKAARVRTRPVPDDFLSNPDRQLDLLDHWRVALETMDERTESVHMQNTAGQDISIQTDRFDIVGPREVVLQRLSTIPGVQSPERDGARDIITVLDTDQSPKSALGSAAFGMTVVGQIILSGKTLTIETNSVERADALKSAVESTVGIALRYRMRASESLASMKQRARERGDAPPLRGKASSSLPDGVFTSMDAMPPEMRAAVQQMMAKFDAEWPDVPVPALGNVTPRAAAQSAKLRPQLIALLKDMEVRQSQRTDGPGMDIAKIRRDLGV